MTNKFPQSLGTSLNQGSTVLDLDEKARVRTSKSLVSYTLYGKL